MTPTTSKTLPRIAVLTPTWQRDGATLRRCIHSVLGQTYKGEIVQMVCTDGPIAPETRQLVEGIHADLTASRKAGVKSAVRRLWYSALGANTRTFGGAVRRHLIEGPVRRMGADYVVSLDDDNILFPDYVEAAVEALEADSQAGFAIARIVHFGPLPVHLGSPPAVLTGIPPVCKNIDTLQVTVRTGVIAEVGWEAKTAEEGGYFNDGVTYERLGATHRYVELPRVLAAHL